VYEPLSKVGMGQCPAKEFTLWQPLTLKLYVAILQASPGC